MAQHGESSAAATLEIGQSGDRGAPEVECSICLESVDASCGRSTVRLQCRHEFHLDCIGSAFNAKGQMQCPNCRQVENGSWIYANGPVLEEIIWGTENSDAVIFEMPHGTHWTSIDRSPQIHSSFEEGQSSASFGYQDDLQEYAFLDEAVTWWPAHTPSHMPYFLEPQPSASLGSLMDGPLLEGPLFEDPLSEVPLFDVPLWEGPLFDVPSFDRDWNHDFSGLANVMSSNASPSNGFRYPDWEHHSNYSPRSSLASGVDQTLSSGLQWASPHFNHTILGHGSPWAPPPMGTAPVIGVPPEIGVPTPMGVLPPRAAPLLFSPQSGDSQVRADVLEHYRH